MDLFHPNPMKSVAAVVIRIVVAFPAVGSGAYAPMPVARMVKHVFSQSIIPRVFVPTRIAPYRRIIFQQCSTSLHTATRVGAVFASAHVALTSCVTRLKVPHPVVARGFAVETHLIKLHPSQHRWWCVAPGGGTARFVGA